MGPLLSQSFFARPALQVAQDLIGVELWIEKVGIRITETEAYCWPDDTANHCRMGRTQRNEPMWGPAGQTYVYLCYGMHSMLNLVTDQVDQGAAVLIRAAEPVAGIEVIRARRGDRSGPTLLAGPGRVGAALGLDPSWSGHPVWTEGGLCARQGRSPRSLRAGPRVGIGYASVEDQAAHWRFADGESAWVSRPKELVAISQE